MGRLIKFMLTMMIIGFLALIAYAYLGPFFGAEFAPQPVEVRQPISLGAD